MVSMYDFFEFLYCVIMNRNNDFIKLWIIFGKEKIRLFESFVFSCFEKSIVLVKILEIILSLDKYGYFFFIFIDYFLYSVYV